MTYWEIREENMRRLYFKESVKKTQSSVIGSEDVKARENTAENISKIVTTYAAEDTIQGAEEDAAERKPECVAENATDITTENTSEKTAETTTETTAETTIETTAEATVETTTENTAEATTEKTAQNETDYATESNNSSNNNIHITAPVDTVINLLDLIKLSFPEGLNLNISFPLLEGNITDDTMLFYINKLSNIVKKYGEYVTISMQED